MRNLIFIVLAVLLLAALTLTLVVYYRRSRRQAGASWQEILSRLTPVNQGNIAIVALDAIGAEYHSTSFEPSASLDPSSIWNLLGGLEGLEILERNCQVLIELAAYVQRWHPEAVVVAEQMRLNAREIEWHVSRLKGAAQTGNLRSAFADYAQRATVTYYQMTLHLLELYRQCGFSQLQALERAI